MSRLITQRAIIESFLKLLNERPLEKISVKDIVEECGISRNTFYYHYQDIYALVEDVFEKEVQLLYGEHKPRDSWQEALLQATEFAIKNKRAIYHIYNSANRDQLERYLYRVCQEIMQDYVERQADGLDVAKEDIAIIALFYKHAVVGIIFEWLQHGMKEDPEEFIRQISRIFEGNIKLTLERVSI